MNFENLDIAVLVPCLNESKTIAKVITDFKRELPNATIYVYDNNSTDDTFSIAEANGAVARKEFRQGKGYAVLSMFSQIDADLYVLIDGDDTYPVNSVRMMLQEMLDKQADMVVGDRLSNQSYKKENKRPFHVFGNYLIKKLINTFFSTNLKDILSGYRIFTKAFVKNYSSLPHGFELETDLSIFCLHYELRILEIPIEYKDRPVGSTSKLNTFKDGIKIIFTFVNLYRSYKPLSFFSLLSLFFFTVGVSLGFFPIYEYITMEYVYKVPTAILALGLVIIALLLFCCGLILDYIVQIEKKNAILKIRNY